MGLVPIITQVLLYGTIFLVVVLTVSYIASKMNGNKETRSQVPSYGTAGYQPYSQQSKQVSSPQVQQPKTQEPVKQNKIYPIELPSKEIRVYKTANFAAREFRTQENHPRESESKQKRSERVPRYTIVNGNGGNTAFKQDDSFSINDFRSANTHRDFFRSASNQ